MKDEYDERMRAKECRIEVGSRVMVKLDKVNKSKPASDHIPYEVIGISDSMVTAARFDRLTTRNSSCLKLVKFNMEQIITPPKSQTGPTGQFAAELLAVQVAEKMAPAEEASVVKNSK